MQHFVLKDVNPLKVKSFTAFLEEMNDITVLTTVAAAPHVAGDYLNYSAENEGIYFFELTENDFVVKFKGEKFGDEVRAGLFEVFEKGKIRIEVSYTINPTLPLAVRVKLDCDGELLVKGEFHKIFQRDFSNEAHQSMDKSLEELRKPPVPEQLEKEIEEPELIEEADKNPVSFDENEALIKSFNEEGEKQEETLEGVGENEGESESIDLMLPENEELVEELSELSDKAIAFISNERDFVKVLNDLCHDITRGATRDFRDETFKEETLEQNGAIVKMIDVDANNYRITYRKGSLGEMSEVSFFLEQVDNLIFSIYLSSVGNGKLEVAGKNAKIILKKVKDKLL